MSSPALLFKKKIALAKGTLPAVPARPASKANLDQKAARVLRTELPNLLNKGIAGLLAEILYAAPWLQKGTLICIGSMLR